MQHLKIVVARLAAEHSGLHGWALTCTAAELLLRWGRRVDRRERPYLAGYPEGRGIGTAYSGKNKCTTINTKTKNQLLRFFVWSLPPSSTYIMHVLEGGTEKRKL